MAFLVQQNTHAFALCLDSVFGRWTSAFTIQCSHWFAFHYQLLLANIINIINCFFYWGPSLLLDSQRSHLSSFTMKLKDKFHSPKIKRTPSKKGKQLQPEPTAKSTEKPANKVCVYVCAFIPEHICVCCEKYTFCPTSICSKRDDCFPVSCVVLSVLHCVCVYTGFSAGSHSFPVSTPAAFATAGA